MYQTLHYYSTHMPLGKPLSVYQDTSKQNDRPISSVKLNDENVENIW
jgi:hypothetical protein